MKNLFHYLSNTKPEKVMEDLQNSPITDHNLDLIDRLTKMGISNEVMNALFLSAFPLMNYKVNTPLVLQMAVQLNRKEIKTFENALDFTIEHLQKALIYSREHNSSKRKNNKNDKKIEMLTHLANNPAVSDEEVGRMFRGLFSKEME